MQIIRPKVELEVKCKSLTLCAQCTTQVKVVTSLNISDRTIHKAKQKLQNYSDVEGGVQKAGPKSKMTPEIETVFVA